MLKDGIGEERNKLPVLRKLADRTIDTSSLSPHELRDEIVKLYSPDHGQDRLRINLISFGFKHGLPEDADMVFDARFLPNPYFQPDLKHKTGIDPEVAGFVLKNESSETFVAQIREMLAFLVPKYREEGKTYLTICIGCTGGKHRSVALVEKIETLLKKIGETALVGHRDISRE